MARKGDGIYKRGRAWRLDCTIDGHRYQLPLGRGIDRTAAVQIATAKRSAILKREVGIIKKRKDMTFQDAAAAFIAWTEANRAENTIKDYKLCLDELAKQFGTKMLSQINPFMLEGYKQKRVKDGAKVRPNRELAVLRAMFNRLTKWKKIEVENPAKEFERVTESRGKDRILSPQEEARLLAAASGPVRSVIIIGLHTGLRVHREALTLKWENIDFNARTLAVEAAFSKTHERREVPLNSVALETLRQLKATTPGPWVFMTRGRRKRGSWRRLISFRSAFETACDHAKLTGVSAHTLRHTWASRLDEAGVTQKTLMELGGWKDPKMVVRYTHSSEQQRKKAVELLAGNSTTLFTTAANEAENGKAANLLKMQPCAPVAQVDRASVS